MMLLKHQLSTSPIDLTQKSLKLTSLYESATLEGRLVAVCGYFRATAVSIEKRAAGYPLEKYYSISAAYFCRQRDYSIQSILFKFTTTILCIRRSRRRMRRGRRGFVLAFIVGKFRVCKLARAIVPAPSRAKACLIVTSACQTGATSLP